MDCSFIAKSGKKTYGLDWFYNGSASRTEKGLEISLIAVIDPETRQAYSLGVQQTPPQKGKLKARKVPKSQSCRQPRVAQATLEQATQMLQELPPLDGASVSALEPELTRLDYYLQQLQEAVPYLPSRLTYWVVDGFYSKKKFVDGVVDLNLQMIGKLRNDANLRYLYCGEQKSRGAKRKYDGTVNLNDLTRWTSIRAIEPQLHLYSVVVWHVSLKRQIRIAAVVDMRKAGKARWTLLFSTDIELDAELIMTYYKARFQIEFLFRDAKQFTGLCDGQTRDPKRLDFHFKASLTALNLAKYEAQSRHPERAAPSPPLPFSMSSYKRLAFNDHLISRFISMLELNPTLIKSHPNYETLRNYGIIAP